MIRKLMSVYVLPHSGFEIRRCSMADSQLILELLFLHIRGGCSLSQSQLNIIPTKYACSIIKISI